MKSRFHRLIPASIIFFLMSTPPAHAICTDGPSTNRPTYGDRYYYRAGAETLQIHFPDKDFNTDYSNGEAIGQIFLINLAAINRLFPTRPPSFRCTGGQGNLSYKGSDNLGIDTNRLYPSGIPGIGYRIYLHTEGTPWSGIQLPAPGPIIPNPATFPGKMLTNAIIVLVKTGPILAVGPFTGSFAAEQMDEQPIFEYQFSGTIPIIYPQKLTCALQPIPAVSLGKYPISKFTGQNTTTSPIDFEVSLNCGGRTPGARINATMTFTDNTQSANMTDALSLYTSNVTGLGVQILKGGNPVHFGPQNAGIGSPNVQNVGPITQPSQAGTFTYRIPLQARYKQTGAAVGGAGPANAQAMVTVNYQ